jgi:hypothetical protein
MKLLLHLLSYFFLVSCAGQKKDLNKSNQNRMHEKIDIEKMKSVSVKSNATVIDEHGATVHTLEYEHSEIQNGSVVKTFSGNDVNGYVVKETHPNKPFIGYKEFYKNGFLKLKGETFKYGNFRSGVWYTFDDKGQLLNETNYELAYKFTINDVLRLLEENKIKLDDKDTKILRTESTDKPVWTVQWRINPQQKEMMKLNGSDGILIERNSYNHPDK